MKKLYPLLIILFLIFWGCEEEQDTTPPTVTITSHQSGESVSELITIIATSEDDDGVSKVEFYIENSLVLTDTESPYEYQWNTTQYDDGSDYVVKVISYDNSDNLTEVEITLRVDNSTASPQGVNITSVTYTLTDMTVEWEESPDGDFKNYKVLYSNTESGDKDTLATYTDKSITSHIMTEFDPTHENWFWVQVTDTLGLSSIDGGMTNEIESIPPFPSVLYPITYNDGFQIHWSQNNDYDFRSYKLYESLLEDMSNQTLVYETTEREDTNYVITGISEDRYYQIISEDVWGLQSTSDIEVLLIQVELWGEFYSIENTTELDLVNSGLTDSIPPEIGNLINLTYLNLNENDFTGSIPSEIGNLTNLTYLSLSSNQLSGQIPESICNISGNLTEFSITENNFCPPYPECLEEWDINNQNCIFQTKEELQFAVDFWMSDNTTALETYGDINTWDVSLITDMSYLFSGSYDSSSTFNDNISNWDVSNVTDMAAMFSWAESFNSDLSNWDVSSVINMSNMFIGCPNFTGDLSNWDVSNVENFENMFMYADLFNGDLSSWNMSSATNISQMFHVAYSFNQDLSNWDVSNVTNMWGIFWRAYSFNGDISNWDVSSVTNMSASFSAASSFNRDISNWDVSSVINMGYMFNNASSFDIDISSWEISNVTNMDLMFDGANNLSEENKCAIHTTFSSNDNWSYDWSEFCND